MPIIRCPTCRRTAEYSTDNPWRPFCSERCKLIDLGEWAQEKHAIPGQPETPGGDFTAESSGNDSSTH